MNARRNSGPVYVDAYGGIAAVFSGDMDRYRAKDKNIEAPVRYKRGKRRKSITVTRKETMPAIRPQSPAPLPPRPRPMKRSDSSISRVSVASEFATIAEDAVCDDFRGEVRQSYPPTAGRRVSFSSASETPPALYNRRSSSSSLVGKSSYNEPPRRRVSIVSLQRSDSTVSSLMDFNPRRLSTVSDAVVIRKTPKSRRRNSADGYVGHTRHASADGNISMSGRRSFPPQSTSRRYHQASGPAYQSYPPPDMEKSKDVFEGSMADRDDLSYEATLRRASLASIHEMHHAISLLKNQKALAKLQKAQGRNSQDGSTGGYSSRRSSLRGSSPRQSVGSGSSRARGNSTASLDAHLRRLSISTSIQDMHQQMTLIKEKQLVKRLNSRVQFSVVEDAARPSESRRGSLASGRRRSSAGGSSISAASMSSMTGGRSRQGSQDSDSHSSNSDYSSSSGSSSDYSGSSSEYSESDSEDSQSSSDDATSSDSDSDTSSDSGSEVSGSDPSSQEAHGSSDDDDRSVASSAGTSSTDTDSGNGTLSSSHGSKTEGQPKGIQDLAGPSGLGRMGRVSPKSPPNTDTQENHFDFSGTHHAMVERGAGDNGAQQKVMKGQATSKACVIL